MALKLDLQVHPEKNDCHFPIFQIIAGQVAHWSDFDMFFFAFKKISDLALITQFW
jgi:hypothetical protein